MGKRSHKICEAPWGCENITAKASGGHSRRVGGKNFCRACYQYAWQIGKEQNLDWKKKAVWIDSLPAPSRIPEPVRAICEGPGCETVLPKNATNNERRFVGRRESGEVVYACRPCYQRAWEYAKWHKGMTIAQAFKKMPSRK